MWGFPSVGTLHNHWGFVGLQVITRQQLQALDGVDQDQQRPPHDHDALAQHRGAHADLRVASLNLPSGTMRSGAGAMATPPSGCRGQANFSRWMTGTKSFTGLRSSSSVRSWPMPHFATRRGSSRAASRSPKTFWNPCCRGCESVLRSSARGILTARKPAAIRGQTRGEGAGGWQGEGPRSARANGKASAPPTLKRASHLKATVGLTPNRRQSCRTSAAGSRVS